MLLGVGILRDDLGDASGATGDAHAVDGEEAIAQLNLGGVALGGRVGDNLGDDVRGVDAEAEARRPSFVVEERGELEDELDELELLAGVGRRERERHPAAALPPHEQRVHAPRRLLHEHVAQRAAAAASAATDPRPPGFTT